jgi:hypothetical protein
MVRVINNKYREKHTYYIGRGTIFGNPFDLKEFTREESIINHKVYFCYLVSNIGPVRFILEDLTKRHNVVLGCFCKPLDCHGDFIKQVLEDYHLIKHMDYLSLLKHYNLENHVIKLPELRLGGDSRTPHQTLIELKTIINTINSKGFIYRVVAYTVMYQEKPVYYKMMSIIGNAVLNNWVGFMYNTEEAFEGLYSKLYQEFIYKIN